MKHLLVISDTHIGSTVGLFKPGFTTLEGTTLYGNTIQKWLWECWNDFNEWIDEKTEGEEFGLVINGDIIDGGMKYKSTQLISPDLADQIELAGEILTPLAKRASSVYVVEGTESHTLNCEHALARRFGAKPDPNTGKPAWPRLELEINGHLIAASHHIGTTSRPYLESGQYSTNLGTEREEAMRAGRRAPDIVLRAHRHRFGQWRDESGMLIVTPPWQALTRFGHKVVPAANCHPGGVLLTWEGDGELPTVRPRIYQPQARKVAKA